MTEHVPADLRTPAGREAMERVLRALGGGDNRWWVRYDTELERITDVHDDREAAERGVAEFNAEDQRLGGPGGLEVREYTLVQVIIALVHATEWRGRLP